MNFFNWLESRQFRRLIPDDVLAIVPKLKQKTKELTDLYFQDKTKIDSYTNFTKLQDPFFPGEMDVAFLSQEEWSKRGYPRGQGVVSPYPLSNGERIIHYQIPMTGFDTIYHELVHAYDPKLAKGVSKSKQNIGFQLMNTPHEVDAHLSGFVDIMREKLSSSTPEDKKHLIDELKSWLRSSNSYETEPAAMPTLLAGMPVYHYKSNPKIWRKFLTTIYNSLSEYE